MERDLLSSNDAHVAVLVPCFNEATTIASVICAFRASLPGSRIYVYDNNSTDESARIAENAGAIVRNERRQGKGYVVRRMFADIEADIYVLVDGDATYDAAAAPLLVHELLSGPFDKVNGARVPADDKAYRPGHNMGNRVLSQLVAFVFGARLRDMLSGYKVLSRRFVKTFPATSSGFEIETELLVHALDLDVPMSEVETLYKERPAGSFSKLSTFRDGAKILWMIIELVRDLLPLQFFSGIALALAVLSIVLAVPVISTYLETGLVPRLPTAVLALGVMLLAFIAFFTGLILDSVAKGRREAKLLAFLKYPNAAQSKSFRQT